MKVSQKNGTRSIVSDIAMGFLLSVVITMISALVITAVTIKEVIDESALKFMIMPVQVLAVVVGALVAGKRANRKYAIVCGSVGVAYCFLLLATTIIFFESSFGAVGSGVGMCILGVAVSCAICMFGKGNGRKRK